MLRARWSAPWPLKPNQRELERLGRAKVGLRAKVVAGAKGCWTGAENILVSLGGERGVLVRPWRFGIAREKARRRWSTPWAPAMRCSADPQRQRSGKSPAEALRFRGGFGSLASEPVRRPAIAVGPRRLLKRIVISPLYVAGHSTPAYSASLA